MMNYQQHQSKGFDNSILIQRRRRSGGITEEKHCRLVQKTNMIKYGDDSIHDSKVKKERSVYHLIHRFFGTCLMLFLIFLISGHFLTLVSSRSQILKASLDSKKLPKRYLRINFMINDVSNLYYQYNGGRKIMDPMLSVTPGEETIPQGFEYHKHDKCVPMENWQTSNRPTCNLIHELNFQMNQNETFASMSKNEFQIIGNGWFRNTWKVSIRNSNDTFVVKTLRFEREFQTEYYELHRRESIAMEMLTKSPFVVDIYAFCAQTSINEYANFIQGFQDFRSFARQLGSRNNDEKILRLKLQVARMIATGVQHIHEIDQLDNATLVHYDINPMNIVVTKGGIPKINDFNLAEFISWNKAKARRCGFEGRFKEPWWRSPEEMKWAFYKQDKQLEKMQKPPLLDEKIDIYSLGNILYILLTGHSPRGRINKDTLEEVQIDVLKGISPVLKNNEASNNKIYLAIQNAMNKCYEKDPRQRSSARDIALALTKAAVNF